MGFAEEEQELSQVSPGPQCPSWGSREKLLFPPLSNVESGWNVLNEYQGTVLECEEQN